MRAQRSKYLLATFFSFFALLLGVGAGHTLLTASSMSSMDKDMSGSLCQSSCNTQFNPVVPEQKVRKDEEDNTPQPEEPDFLRFMGVGWSLTLLASASLLRHLRWKPPDIFKLNVAYRF